MTSPAITLTAAARARSTPSTVQVGLGRATVNQPVHTTSPPIAPTASAGRRSSPAVRASTTIHPRLTHRNARIPSDSTARPRSASDGTVPELDGPVPESPTSPPTRFTPARRNLPPWPGPRTCRVPGTPEARPPASGPPVGEATPTPEGGAPPIHSPGVKPPGEAPGVKPPGEGPRVKPRGEAPG